MPRDIENCQSYVICNVFVLHRRGAPLAEDHASPMIFPDFLSVSALSVRVKRAVLDWSVFVFCTNIKTFIFLSGKHAWSIRNVCASKSQVFAKEKQHYVSH